MTPRARGAIVASLAVLALAGCSAPATAESGSDPTEPLVFAMPPGTDDPELATQVDTVAALIAEATGREVVVEQPADYLGVVEAVRNGFVDVALMSPFSTALAVENGSVDPLLAWEADQEPASYCLVRADSDIEELADVEGRTIAFVDPGSATGHFMPRSQLAQEGLVAGEDYTSTFSGGHDSGILAMVNGSVDVACTARQLVPVFEEAGLFAEGEVRIISESGPIPVGITIIARTDLDDTTRQQIIDFLPDALATDGGALEIFGGSDRSIANPGSDIFDPLLKVAQDVGISLEDIR